MARRNQASLSFPPRGVVVVRARVVCAFLRDGGHITQTESLEERQAWISSASGPFLLSGAKRNTRGGLLVQAGGDPPLVNLIRASMDCTFAREIRGPLLCLCVF